MGQLKIIELTETYTGIRFQDFEKIQSESQSLPRLLGGRLFSFKAASQACLCKMTRMRKAINRKAIDWGRLCVPHHQGSASMKCELIPMY